MSKRSTRWGQKIKTWRRNNRRRANRWLARLVGRTQPRCAPLAADTRRILVLRLNKRLGNILFLTPMLRSLAATFPAARIDVVIQNPAQATLLESLPGIGHVWVQGKSVTGILRLLRTVRREKYDLAIDPNGNSASNRFALALAGARQRLGFATSDQWVSLTHASPRASSRHPAIQGVELLTGAIADYHVEPFDTLAVFPGAKARQAAENHWHRALNSRDARRPVIGFFAHATGRKQLSRQWWQTWITAMQAQAPEAMLLEILPGPDTARLADDIAAVSIEPLDELSAVLGRLDVFVAADSGPMHLAAASGIPVVGLFRATSPQIYAPLGQDCISLEGHDLTGTAVAEAVAARLPRQGARRHANTASGAVVDTPSP